MSPEHALSLAVEAGALATCQKSLRGVVIFHPHDPRRIAAFNGPPAPFACDGSAACRAACNQVAVHAEERAIVAALADGFQLDLGWQMLHVKVVDGQAVPSGPPSCVKCSRLILEAGISTMWLLHADGLVSYPAERFHELSLAHHGLPTTRRA